MSKGWDRVASETQERQERQAQFEQGRVSELWLREGQATVVRFLEQGPDINNFLRHPYKIVMKKGPQNRWMTCFNDGNDGTPCPGCQGGLESKVRGVYNIIQRDRPVLRKGQDGKALRDNDGNFIVDGHEDAVVMWVVGSITAEALRQMDSDYNGLMSRDFKVSRTSGSSFQPYVFSPADPDAGAVGMSEADLELLKAKHNLDEAMAPPTFVEAAKIVASQAQFGGGGGGGSAVPAQSSQPAQQPVQAGNPFMGDPTQQQSQQS